MSNRFPAKAGKHRLDCYKLPPNFFYRKEDPITLDDGEPEPEGAVIRGTREDYRTRKPRAVDVALVIEVADSSLSLDRGGKLRSYARAGIPSYWIINLIDRSVEVYTRPDASSAQPTYLDREVRREADTVPLIIDGTNLGHIPVRDLLP